MTSDKSQIHTPTPVNTKEAKTTNVRRNQADFYSSWAQKATTETKLLTKKQIPISGFRISDFRFRISDFPISRFSRDFRISGFLDFRVLPYHDGSLGSRDWLVLAIAINFSRISEMSAQVYR